jgi:hypothetical protein
MRYSDNYFWLEAGEKRVVEVSVLSQKPESIQISAWNAKRINLTDNAVSKEQK